MSGVCLRCTLLQLAAAVSFGWIVFQVCHSTGVLFVPDSIQAVLEDCRPVRAVVGTGDSGSGGGPADSHAFQCGIDA